ncbi:hypothetical protein [Variovorax sp. LG9.2]|uniref:hypothetical protein n=1 Tax=Variovorax sp. LG9.2 TaxID=3048626 RepID=UPI002B2346B4|nr:hypothetical protein [Variovorax sp. LG9.2]MEB0059255.1 hypothetical protein [Variovorax sp. LG9.2]
MYDSKLLQAGKRDGLATVFARHYVSLVVMGRWPNGDVLKTSYSAFIFCSPEQWYLTTAGHNIADLKQAVDTGGLHSLSWQLGDSFAGGVHPKTLPFDGRLDEWVVAYEQLEPGGADLAAFRLHGFHTRALQVNGVVPLDLGADFIRLAERPCGMLLVLGVPKEKSAIGLGHLSQTLFAIPALGIADTDVAPILRNGFRRHFGVIDSEVLAAASIDSVVGTSGGPVFGLWFSVDGKEFDYAAIGIQSSWDARSRQIAAWPLDGVSRALATAFKDS